MRSPIAAALIGLSLTFASSAHAKLTVGQLKLDQGFVVLKISDGETHAVGDIVEVAGDDACQLKIYYVKSPWAGATTKNCPSANTFTVGQVLATGDAPAPAPPEQLATPPPISEKPMANGKKKDTPGFARDAKFHHFGAFLYYSAATTVNEKFTLSGTDPSTGTNQSIPVDHQYATSGAPGLGIRYTFIKRFPKPVKQLAFGGMLGFSLEGSRKLKQIKDNLKDGEVSDVADLNLKLSLLEANFVVEYNGFYGLVGPNYSLVTIDGSSATDLVNYGGGLGYQLGAGYSFAGFMGLEVLYRTVKGNVSSAIIGLQPSDVAIGLNGLLLRLRADFSLK